MGHVADDTGSPMSDRTTAFRSLRYDVADRKAYITLARPERLNAIDRHMPGEIHAAVDRANDDPDVHVIVLRGEGRSFCAGYDLKAFAEGGVGTQGTVWDPIKDYRAMKRNTDDFTSLFRSLKPTICQVQGHAVAGGSDIALCCDLVVMADDARIGYMPARVWGCPTTAMWVYRLGAERAKRMLLTGDTIDGRQAAEWGLVLESVPADDLDGAGRRTGGSHGGRADQPAGDAEADGQPGLRQHGAARHPDPGDGLRRHHPSLAGGPLVPATRSGRGVPRGGRVAGLRAVDTRGRRDGRRSLTAVIGRAALEERNG